MRVEVVVVPKSGAFRLVRKDDRLKVFLKSPPEGNRANMELVRGMEKELWRKVRIIAGIKSRHKVLEVDIGEEEWGEFLRKIASQGQCR